MAVTRRKLIALEKETSVLKEKCDLMQRSVDDYELILHHDILQLHPDTLKSIKESFIAKFNATVKEELEGATRRG